ncbi:YqcC family protein [Psychromonas sp. MME2]|uniref:YqcC family protein n=1 Tax=unclassified Psychromonas TaxID=2614957 RepID=UPI00339BF3A1
MIEIEPERQTRHLLAALLHQLESELRLQALWQRDPPSEAALQSREPFAIDTLNFVQWLQFIFLPKMINLLRYSLPLPTTICVAPMANEYFKALPLDSRQIEDIISRIDHLLSEPHE